MGLLGDFISQTYPPAPKFGENDVPDLSGKIVIVTGGNTGIGKCNRRIPVIYFPIPIGRVAGKETARVRRILSARDETVI